MTAIFLRGSFLRGSFLRGSFLSLLTAVVAAHGVQADPSTVEGSESTPIPEVQPIEPPPPFLYGDPKNPGEPPPGGEEPPSDPYYPPDDAPPQPPPPAPPLPHKVVQVQFCIVDDGRLFGRHPSKAKATNRGNPNGVGTNRGDPDGRFDSLPVADIPIPWLGLLVKNAIFAQAGVSFAVGAPTVYIADPHPNNGPAFAEGGELGDVVEPGDDLRSFDSLGLTAVDLVGDPPKTGKVKPDGPAQWAAVRQACRKAAMKQDPVFAAGSLLEIVIRRFVRGIDSDPKGPDGKFDEDTRRDNDPPNNGDQDKDGANGEDDIEPSNLLGISPRPKCSHEPPAIDRTPTVIDPEVKGVGAFGFVLAHENGHALCLDDAPGPPQRLMSPFVPPFQPTFTPGEITRLRAQAQHLSGTRDKDAQGHLIERTGPVTRYGVDDVGEVDGAVDLFGTGVAWREDGSLGLLFESATLLPEDRSTLVRFSIDLDASEKSGALGREVGEQPLPGTDLRIDVTLEPSEEGLKPSGMVFVAEGGELFPLEGAELELKLGKVYLPRGQGIQTPTHHSLFVVIPHETLPMEPHEGFRSLVEVSDAGGSAYDRGPVVEGSVTPDWSGHHLALEPRGGPVGSPVVARGTGFTPSSEVAFFAGTKLIGTTRTNELGAFASRFEIPEPNEKTGSPLSRGAVMPITVFDPQRGGDVALLRVTVPGSGE